MYSELRAPLIFTRWKLLRKFYEMYSLSNKILFYRYDSVSVTLLSFTIWLTIRLLNLDLELKLRRDRKYEY